MIALCLLIVIIVFIVMLVYANINGNKVCGEYIVYFIIAIISCIVQLCISKM